MTAFDPLYGPDEEPPFPADVDAELEMSHQVVDEVAGANIHDHDAMLRAASKLNYRMRSLLAAIEAERGAK